jgi:hypothetical protein
MKSDVKNKFLYELFPECFSLDCTESFDIVVDDVIISLRGRIFGVVSHAPCGKFTVAELTRVCFRKCVQDVANGVKVYICVWDKASFVESAKAPEQGQRDEQGAGEADTLAYATLEHLRCQMKGGACPRTVYATGAEWAAMINNRRCRQAVIKMLSSAAISEVPAMLREGNAPPAAQVWVDWDSTVAGPVCITSTGTTRRLELKNELGEFDVSHLVYVHAAAKGAFELASPRVLVRTIDTDILCINMLHRTGVTVETTLAKHKKSPVRVDTAALTRGVLNRWPSHSMRDFCECYLVSGSDFVIGGIRGVGQVNILKTFYAQTGKLQAVVQRMAKGRTQGSAAVARECGVNHRLKRARYALDYWVDADTSARDPSRTRPRPAQPVGYGWAVNAGEIVCEETICPICIAHEMTHQKQKRKL